MDETKKTIKKKVIVIRKKRKTLKSPNQKDEEINQKNKNEEKQKKMRKEQQKKYIENLDEKEKQALEIAKDHLKSSFDLEKSIDFINWNNKK